jgi:hypothetical protein
MTCDSRLLQKLQSTRELPTLPAVLLPLLGYLEQPLDTLDMHKVVHLVSQDKALAARYKWPIRPCSVAVTKSIAYKRRWWRWA